MAFLAKYEQTNLKDAINLPKDKVNPFYKALHIVTKYDEKAKLGCAWIICPDKVYYYAMLNIGWHLSYESQTWNQFTARYSRSKDIDKQKVIEIIKKLATEYSC